MSLKDEISEKRKEMVVDSYPKVIREIMEQISAQILSAAIGKSYLLQMSKTVGIHKIKRQEPTNCPKAGEQHHTDKCK